MVVARAAVQNLVGTDAQLTALGFVHVYGGNSVDTPREDRFVTIRWEGNVAAFGDRGAARVLIGFHDKDRDYAQIDKALARLQVIMDAAVHVPGADDRTLTVTKWDGDSADLFDDGYGTVVRYGEYTVASRSTG